jgi:hypothetical protein
MSGPAERERLQAALAAAEASAAEASAADAKGRLQAAYDIRRTAPPRVRDECEAAYQFALREMIQATAERNRARAALARGETTVSEERMRALLATFRDRELADPTGSWTWRHVGDWIERIILGQYPAFPRRPRERALEGVKHYALTEARAHALLLREPPPGVSFLDLEWHAARRATLAQAAFLLRDALRPPTP